MYTIYTQDHLNQRYMDWIYRNIPGAKVKRRTHQVVEVPPFPHQEVFQTLINLPVSERTGEKMIAMDSSLAQSHATISSTATDPSSG